MYSELIFLLEEKNNNIFSRYLIFFVFLVNPQTSKSMTSSQTSLHIRSYSFDCFFKILGSIKMKFCQIKH